MTIRTHAYAPEKAPHRRDTIDAKTVGWALTAATACSLIVGLALVAYLGRVSGPPPTALDPTPRPARTQTDRPRPTVLPPQGRGLGDAAEELQGFHTLFDLPPVSGGAGGAAPTPTPEVATTPSTLHLR